MTIMWHSFLIWIALSMLLPLSVSADELLVWARLTFEEEGLAFSQKEQLILPFPVMPQNPNAGSYLALRHFPGNGAKSLLKPLAFKELDGENHGWAITPGKFEGKDISGGELLLLLDHIGDMPSSSDLMMAFKIFIPEDDIGEYRVTFWNQTKSGKKADIRLQLRNAQWNFIKIPLHVPNSIDTGDIVRNLTIYSKTTKTYRWIVDDIVVWSGHDSQQPQPVAGLAVKADDDDNILTWNASNDNLAIAFYEIHRGTVQDFTPSATTAIGRTSDCHFRDVCPMHEDSFYRIIAIDYADNPSPASNAVRRP